MSEEIALATRRCDQRRRRHVAVLPWAAAVVLLALPLPAAESLPAPMFRDITAESGVEQVVQSHYAQVPKWWLSGLDLVDLDGDGDLDLHLGGHGTPAAAAINAGRGHFTYVDPQLSVPRGVRGNAGLPYPGGEIRLAFDFNEDGRIDLLCSWHDGGGVLYENAVRPRGRSPWTFRRSHALDHFNRATAMADLDRDGRVDYLADAGDGRGSDPHLAVFLGKGHSYYTPVLTERHFGLGTHETVDVRVEFYPSGRSVERQGVAANTTLEVREP